LMTSLNYIISFDLAFKLAVS